MSGDRTGAGGPAGGRSVAVRRPAGAASPPTARSSCTSNLPGARSRSRGDPLRGRHLPGGSPAGPALRRPGPLRPLRRAGERGLGPSPLDHPTGAGGDRRGLRPGLPDSGQQRRHGVGAARSRSGSSAWPAAIWPRRPPRRLVLCEHHAAPWVSRYHVTVEPPSMDDNTPDLERLQRELARQHGLRGVSPSLTALAKLAASLARRRVDGHRRGGTARLAEMEACPTSEVISVCSTCCPAGPRSTRFGLAVDIGTTTVVTYLGDLATGRLVDARVGLQRADRLRRGRDLAHHLCPAAASGARNCRTGSSRPSTHSSTRCSRSAPSEARRHRRGDGGGQHHDDPPLPGPRTGLHPSASHTSGWRDTSRWYRRRGSDCTCIPRLMVDCLPAVGAYVGGDITAGVVRSGMHEEEPITLFIDIGTNGEMVLGNSEWLISCACSAGPGFRGRGRDLGHAGRERGHRRGLDRPAHARTDHHDGGGRRPSRHLRLGNDLAVGRDADHRRHRQERPDRSPTPRPTGCVEGENGLEYVVVWAGETATGEKDIVLDETDIHNLLRAKGAIYAGASVLCESVGLSITDVDRVLIGGSFGRHIDVEKAIQIGLLPDLPWDRFSYLGQHLAPGRLPGPHLPRASRSDRRDRRQDDLSGAERRQPLHGRVHLGALPPPHRREPVPVGRAGPWRLVRRRKELSPHDSHPGCGGQRRHRQDHLRRADRQVPAARPA